MWIQIAAVVAEALSLLAGLWFAVQYFRLRARSARLEESERHFRDRAVDAETRHDRLQDRLAESEFERDEFSKFVIICSACRELVPPGMPYTTQYPRDNDGRMTGADPTYTCDNCERQQQADPCADAEPGTQPDYAEFEGMWEDSTMDELNDVCDWCGEPHREHHAVCASEAERAAQR